MRIDRRDFLRTSGAALGAGALAVVPGCGPAGRPGGWWRRGAEAEGGWGELRAGLRLDPAYIHMAGLLIASHPAEVSAAIQQYRAELDENPAHTATTRSPREVDTRQSAATYLGVHAQDVAITDSTTMGIALVYAGLRIRPDQEVITTEHDYYSTRESLRYLSERTGATVRYYRLFERHETATEAEIVENVIRAVGPATRAVAATWVHSSTGLKLPVRAIADALAPINAGRAEDDRVLLCLDGVHGLGVEDVPLTALGCDFFMAGAHKWLLGPRGTGVLWGNPEVQAHVTPTIPTFTRDNTWGGDMTPGGYKPFEHQWALAEAFQLHRSLGKDRVQQRIHDFASQLKEALRQMPHVHLHTPLESRLSAGIVCFEVDGMRPQQVVDRLERQGIIASTTPYSPSYPRLTPGIFNTPQEIARVAQVMEELG